MYQRLVQTRETKPQDESVLGKIEGSQSTDWAYFVKFGKAWYWIEYYLYGSETYGTMCNIFANVPSYIMNSWRKVKVEIYTHS